MSAGYSNIRACFIQPVISMAEAIDFVMMSASEIAPAAMKSGLVSEQDAKQMLTELQNLKYEHDANYTFPRQAQIYGYK
jgi:uncharacterized protein YlaN (UPF0358 family)